ncbi:MAG: hypothetical protein AAGG50_20820 [Bacteroidota bacterium]
MTHSKTLYHTPQGHVLRCGCCDHLEVVFRQTLIRLKPEDLGALAKDAASVNTEHWEVGSLGVVRVTPPGTDIEVRLLLECEALREWQDLLAGTAAMLELDDLIADTLS